jgi:hypothetical protein
VLAPEGQELVARRVAVHRSPQPLRGDERDVMVARERLECAVSLHHT